MPVISPIKTDASAKPDVTAEAVSAKRDTASTENKTAEKPASATEQGVKKTSTTTTVKRMVQTADQWRNCSRPHRI
ncbi:MAG: hypothetical protein AAFV85_07560 [Cyanobacteria bacterium J06634_6]